MEATNLDSTFSTCRLEARHILVYVAAVDDATFEAHERQRLLFLDSRLSPHTTLAVPVIKPV